VQAFVISVKKSITPHDFYIGRSGDRIPLGRDFPHSSRPALGPTQSPKQWVPALYRVGKAAGGVALTTHPHVAPVLKKK